MMRLEVFGVIDRTSFGAPVTDIGEGVVVVVVLVMVEAGTAVVMALLEVKIGIVVVVAIVLAVVIRTVVVSGELRIREGVGVVCSPWIFITPSSLFPAGRRSGSSRLPAGLLAGAIIFVGLTFKIAACFVGTGVVVTVLGDSVVVVRLVFCLRVA
jgi:hypothetical protein